MSSTTLQTGGKKHHKNRKTAKHRKTGGASRSTPRPLMGGKNCRTRNKKHHGGKSHKRKSHKGVRYRKSHKGV